MTLRRRNYIMTAKEPKLECNMVSFIQQYGAFCIAKSTILGHDFNVVEFQVDNV